MKTDTYTKFVLTVIALCLIIIVAEKMLITPANAHPSPQLVNVPMNADGTINVRVADIKAGEVIIAGWKNKVDDSPSDYQNLAETPLPVRK